ncbi:MAG: PAS domain S-box protein [Acidobacteria bacterium]|nr:PAS domain S-box protein [Acidobacteriota bacterium]
MKELDFHRNPDGRIYLCYLVPFPSPKKTPSLSGVIILAIDAARHLLPYIQTWPIPSQTAETLVVRREGEHMLFLNSLRYAEGGLLASRFPIARSSMAEALLLRRREGVLEGTDYRGAKVLAALRRIPGSDWALIAKEDQEEIYAPIRRRAWFTLTGVVLATALGGAWVGLLSLRRETHLLRREYEAERERRALAGRYENLMRYANDVVLLVEPGGRIGEANERAVSTYGYTTEELLRLPARELDLHPEQVDLDRLWDLSDSPDGLVFEAVHRRKDGSLLPVEVSSRVIALDGERVRLAIIRDVTARKAAEAELRKTSRTLRLLGECNQALIRATGEPALLERLCRLVVNDGGYRMACVAFAEQDPAKSVRVLAKAGHDAGYTDSAEVTWAEEPRGLGPSGTAIRTRKPAVVRDITTSPEFAPWRDQALQRGYASATALPLTVEGSVVGVLKIFSAESDAFDEPEMALLTELADDLSFGIQVLRRRAEQARTAQALQESEGRFRAAFDQAPVGMVVTGLNGRLRQVNAALCAMLDYPAEELVGRSFIQITHPDDVVLGVQAIQQMLREPEHRATVEKRYLRKDGKPVWAQVMSRTLRDATGRPYSLITHVREITEERRARQALEKSQAIAKLATFEVDLRGGKLVGSDEMYRVFGLDKAEPLPTHEEYLEMIPFTDRERVRAAIRDSVSTGTRYEVEHRLERPDGAERHVRVLAEFVSDAGGNTAGMLGTIQDITDFRRLEEQFYQAQKLVSVGRLAGGIAHDFNNLLTVINGYCELLLDQPGMDRMTQARLGDILNAGKRAASLTGQLLAFSRKQVIQPVLLDLNHLVEEVRDMLRRLVPESIAFQVRLSPEPCLLRADRGQLGQVLMNLVVNARDAMPAGGSLLIETASVDLEREQAAGCHGLSPGPHVVLTVRDTGTGMTEEVRRQVFEPFFTTKPKGVGTGLGLSTVYGIVSQSGGSICLQSEVGKGTIFKIYLPRAQGVQDDIRQGDFDRESLRGDETILLVEDMEELRILAEVMLTEFGYHVLSAPGGEDAMRVAGEYSGAIHLLVTDVVMPGMTGPEIAQRIETIRPQLGVLYMSGYTDDEVGSHGVFQNRVHLLQKPFTSTELARKVREILDGKRR